MAARILESGEVRVSVFSRELVVSVLTWGLRLPRSPVEGISFCLASTLEPTGAVEGAQRDFWSFQRRSPAVDHDCSNWVRVSGAIIMANHYLDPPLGFLLILPVRNISWFQVENVNNCRSNIIYKCCYMCSPNNSVAVVKWVVGPLSDNSSPRLYLQCTMYLGYRKMQEVHCYCHC